MLEDDDLPWRSSELLPPSQEARNEEIERNIAIMRSGFEFRARALAEYERILRAYDLPDGVVYEALVGWLAVMDEGVKPCPHCKKGRA